jgi:hypothetical protein
MTKGLLAVLALLVGFNPTTSFSCDIDGKTGIVEENDLWIGPDEKNNISSVTREDFMDAIDRIEKIYAPVIRAKGGELVINRKWEDGTVNASAQRMGNKWVVNMYGGLARHEAITKDGFTMVLCHELGHHIGGMPKKKQFWMTTWAANEGQSDYFASLKCMRRYLAEQDNVAHVAKLNVPEFVTQKCNESFTTQDELALCQRNAMAGLSLGNLFKALKKLTVPLKFETPDPKKVAQTDHNHPQPQCRLDTYFAGALCNRPVSEEVSDTDATAGVCSRKRNEAEIKTRPLCWYNPKPSSGGGGGGGNPFPFPFPIPRPPGVAVN